MFMHAHICIIIVIILLIFIHYVIIPISQMISSFNKIAGDISTHCASVMNHTPDGDKFQLKRSHKDVFRAQNHAILSLPSHDASNIGLSSLCTR